MRAIVCGANGAMGKLIQASLGEARVAGLVSIDGENGVPKTFAELGLCGADAIIDFSHHSAVSAVIGGGGSACGERSDHQHCGQKKGEHFLHCGIPPSQFIF